MKEQIIRNAESHAEHAKNNSEKLRKRLQKATAKYKQIVDPARAAIRRQSIAKI